MSVKPTLSYYCDKCEEIIPRIRVRGSLLPIPSITTADNRVKHFHKHCMPRSMEEATRTVASTVVHNVCHHREVAVFKVKDDEWVSFDLSWCKTCGSIHTYSPARAEITGLGGWEWIEPSVPNPHLRREV